MDELRALWKEGRGFEPQMSPEQREEKLARWHQAVEASMNWVHKDQNST
jgi:glycerol kinase